MNKYKPLNFIIIIIRIISNETIFLAAIWKKRGNYNEKVFFSSLQIEVDSIKKTQYSIITILCTQYDNTLKLM